MKEIQVGLIGFGTVGTGVVKILLEKEGLLQSLVGAPLKLKRIADLDLNRDRGVLVLQWGSGGSSGSNSR